jgi:FHA domain
MITCQRCQTENLDGSQYCDECGAALAGQPAQGPVRRAVEDGADARWPATAPAPEPLTLDPLAQEPPRGTTAETPAAASSQALSPAARTSLVGQAGAQRRAEDSAARRVEESAARRGASGTAHAKLVIHRGRSVGKEFPLSEDESHIGRWDADGGIFPDVDLDSDDPEAKVSRRHARITRRGGQYYIEDLGSTNGTFVNRGRRLLPGDRQSLRDGDEVIVGKTFLKFHVLN